MIKTLDHFYAFSAGRCPAFDVDLNLQLPRYCPLAVELWKFTQGEYLGLPFGCASYRIDMAKESLKRTGDRSCPCPLEESMVLLALTEVRL